MNDAFLGDIRERAGDVSQDSEGILDIAFEEGRSWDPSRAPLLAAKVAEVLILDHQGQHAGIERDEIGDAALINLVPFVSIFSRRSDGEREASLTCRRP